MAMRRIGDRSLQELSHLPWNGFLEMTDEAKFGMAAFQACGYYVEHLVDVVGYDNVEQHKLYVIQCGTEEMLRSVQLKFLRVWEACTIGDVAFSNLDAIGLSVYFHQQRLVRDLMNKVHFNEAVRRRWLPEWAPRLNDIEDFLNCEDEADHLQLDGSIGSVREVPAFATVAQRLWFVLEERMRGRIKSGFRLRTFLYGLAWLTKVRMMSENGWLDSLKFGLRTLEAWIVTGTCSSCVIKSLQYERAFERDNNPYRFNVGDTFSQLVSADQLWFALQCGACPSDGAVFRSINDVRKDRDGYLRYAVAVFDEHYYLLSSYAFYRREVVFRFKDGTELKVKLTVRHLTALLQIMDLNARVMRAEIHGCGARVLSAWLDERKIILGQRPNDLIDVYLDDFTELYFEQPALQGLMRWLAVTAFTAKVSRLVLRDFRRYLKGGDRRTIHQFMVEELMSKAPDRALADYSHWLISSFRDSSADERNAMVGFPYKEATQRFEEYSFVVRN